MAAAWAAASLSHTAKIVLLSLADNANDSGVCWPSISTVAKRCSLDERSVYRMITTLESGGHISTESRAGKSTIYRVHPCQSGTPDRGPEVTVSQVPPDRQSQTPDSVSGTPDSLSPRIIKNLKEPKGNRKRRAARPVGAVLHESLPSEEWEQWLTHRRTKRWPIDAVTLNKQLQELARYDTPTQREMINRSINAGWQGIFAPRGGAGVIRNSIPNLITADEAEARERARGEPP